MFAVAYEEVSYPQARARFPRQNKRGLKARLAVLSCITLLACILAMCNLNAKMLYNSYDVKIKLYQKQCETINRDISELQAKISALKDYDRLELKAKRIGLVPILATYHLDLNSYPVVAQSEAALSKSQF